MKILIVGNGAREHIIAEKIASDSDLFCIMGKKNPAMASISKEWHVCDIHNPSEVSEWADKKDIDVAFASPDAVLEAGVSDALEKKGISVCSPTKKASRIEWDKEFARKLMKKNSIPGLPGFGIADSVDSAHKLILEYKNVAVKPVGLTGGKGVKISGDHLFTQEDTLNYCSELIEKDGKVLVEKKLEGEEFTLQAFCDGEHIVFMPPVQDHKRAFEGDNGPNTGGMGAYSTGKNLPFLTDTDLISARETMEQTLEAMRKEGVPFKGILYGQFMATAERPKVIEFNARFGDPEAMNVLSVLKTPLSRIFIDISKVELHEALFEEKSTVVKYLVPAGYPSSPKKDAEVKIDGGQISGSGAKVYYASVYEKDGKIYTTSSRSFGVVGISDKFSDAEKTAESAMQFISGPVWHRKDIGTPELIQKKTDHMQRIRNV
ncbi:phosphoribosylamine--glycine ligase [Candidatus Micrarchaeota archaeon]|nr:phosphoribosylamine--glycine ligase [Candidatus Micrarchaeota archaeon]